MQRPSPSSFSAIVFLVFSSLVIAQEKNKPLAIIPFEMDGAHILVYGSVNGSEQIPFTFDTGGSTSLIDTEKAKDIGLEISGKTQGLGASGPIDFNYSLGNTLVIGDLVFEQSMFVTTSLAQLRDFGSKTYGVLGYQEISKYVIKIDYEKKKLTFYDKDQYSYDGKGMKIPIGLEMQIPSITCTLQLADGTNVTGSFLIDTGAALYGSMNTPSVIKYKAVESLAKSYEIEAAGASGNFKMTSGRIGSLSLGNETFDDLPFTFNSATSGALASSSYVGIIGNRIMRRYNIVLDYSRKKLILEPNVFHMEKYKVNASGILTTTNSEGRLVVKEIIKGSPADRAGIKTDDIITSVNKIKGVAKNRSKIRELFEEDGHKATIEWVRNGTKYSTEIILENII